MHNDIITQTVKELIQHMHLDCESVEVVPESGDSHPRVLVKSKDSAVLIGTKGEHLSALNIIARRLVAKKLPPDIEAPKFFVDVNGYLEHAVKDLEMKAKVMAERARSFRTSVELEPMTAYERMVIHSALQSMTDIKTESTGFGKNRRVVIKHVENDQKI